MIHAVTVYIPPGDTKETKRIIRLLRWILFRIFNMDAKSSVMVMGDFNLIAMKKTDFLNSQYGLT